MATKNRSELKTYFVKNAIPTEANFADLVDAPLNQADDGVFKLQDEPLAIVAAPGEQKRVLRFFGSYPAAAPEWMLSLNPSPDPAQPGFGVVDGTSGALRLFVSKTTGRVGVGTNVPRAMLHVEGDARVTGPLNVAGATTLGSNLTGAAASFSGPVAVTGTTTLGTTTLAGATTASGTLRTTNVLETAGPMRINGGVDVNSAARLNGTLDVTSFTRLSGLLTCTAAAVLQNTATVHNGLIAVGNARVLSLAGSNHVYMDFCPVGTAAGRRGWLGFGTPNGLDMGVVNEAGPLTLHATGHLNLQTAAGFRVQAGGGAMLNQIGVGLPIAGSSFGYESIQMNAGHNLRIFFGTTERMVLTNGGDMTHTANLGNHGFSPNGGGNFPGGWGGGVHTWDVVAEGSIGYGASRQWSSIREKTDIRPLEGALATLDKLTPSTFKKAGEQRMGFIAEEVLEAFAQGAAAGDEFFANGIAPDAILALTVRAVQELADKVQALEDLVRPKKRALKAAPKVRIQIVREGTHDKQRYVTAWFHATGGRRVARTIRLAKGEKRDGALEAEYARWEQRLAASNPNV